MSELKAIILNDIKQAMRDKNKDALGALRNLSAAIKQKEIDDGLTDGVTDNDVIEIITNMIKQRRDSASQYRDGGRADLAEQEEAEIALYQPYLPQALTHDEIVTIIEEAINRLGASSMADMQALIADIKPKMLGRADLGAVSSLVREKLGKSA